MLMRDGQKFGKYNKQDFKKPSYGFAKIADDEAYDIWYKWSAFYIIESGRTCTYGEIFTNRRK